MQQRVGKPGSVRTSQAQRLEALHRYRILDTEREAAFDDITRIAAQVCQAPIAVINLIDADRQWFKSEIGLGVRETPLDISICAHAILQPGLFIVHDTLEDERFVRNPLVTGEPHLRFYAGALLETSDGHPLGTLCVLDYEPRDLTEMQKDTLQALARQVMNLLELHRINLLQADMLAEAERAAEERATLLHELQHRVKNNFQMIASLLRLQQGREKSPEAKIALDKLHNRLQALVAVAEQFDHAEQVDRIDLAPYLRQLATNILTFNEGKGCPVTLDLDLASVTVPTATALPVGLIVNEFATNSYKHAFADRTGTLTVRLERANDRTVRVTLADDGPGLPPDVGPEGLGLQIIPALARQIEAECEWASDGGARLVLSFEA